MCSFSAWFTEAGTLPQFSICERSAGGSQRIHMKRLNLMFGPKGNPTATNLFDIIACLPEHEGVKLEVKA